MKSNNNGDDRQPGVAQKLDTIIRLLAAILTKGAANKTDAILSLAGTGMSPKEIADVLSVSAHHASQTIYAARKAGRKELVNRNLQDAPRTGGQR